MTISLSDIPDRRRRLHQGQRDGGSHRGEARHLDRAAAEREGQVRRRRHEQRQRPAHQPHLRAVDLARRRGQARLPRRDAHRRPEEASTPISDVIPNGDEATKMFVTPNWTRSPTRRSIPARASPTRSCRSSTQNTLGDRHDQVLDPCHRRPGEPVPRRPGELGGEADADGQLTDDLRLAAERGPHRSAPIAEAPMSDTARLGEARPSCLDAAVEARRD